MTDSKNDWCFRQMAFRQRNTIGFETIFFKNICLIKNIKSHKISRLIGSSNFSSPLLALQLSF